MIIEFESSGGFANLRLSYHADTAAFPQDQAERLSKLIQDSGVLELEPSDVAPTVDTSPPDILHYRLSLTEGNRQQILIMNDATAPVSLRPLLSALQKLALENQN